MSEAKKEEVKNPSYQVCLAACMIVVVLLGGIFYSTYQDQLAWIDSLKANVEALQNQVNALSTEISELRSSFDELNRSYGELYGTYLSVFPSNDSLKPPVSKLEAVIIALEHGKWNATTLIGYDVSVRLIYSKFQYWRGGMGYELLHYVTEPVSDYSAVQVDDTIYRYLWYVIVNHIGRGSIPPPGDYLIDAATGEIIPVGPPE